MRKVLITGALLTALVVILLDPNASSLPDGLEKVAIKYGFIEREREVIKSPFPDYKIKLTNNEKISTALAGLTGSVIVFITVVLLFKFLGNRDETSFFR